MKIKTSTSNVAKRQTRSEASILLTILSACVAFLLSSCAVPHKQYNLGFAGPIRPAEEATLKCVMDDPNCPPVIKSIDGATQDKNGQSLKRAFYTLYVADPNDKPSLAIGLLPGTHTLALTYHYHTVNWNYTPKIDKTITFKASAGMNYDLDTHVMITDYSATAFLHQKTIWRAKIVEHETGRVVASFGPAF